MKLYDITFVGHMCYDEIIPFEGKSRIAPGSAVLCGAVVAARTGKKVAAIVKMAQKDESILAPMKQLGIDVYVIPSNETTYSKVIHPVADVDVRRLILEKSAGPIAFDEMPDIETKYMHLAGISDQEFTMDLLEALKNKGYHLSTDMQSFVRQVDQVTKEISFNDVAMKKEIVSMMEKVKLDVVEAKILTGREDLEEAALVVESWGGREIMITHSEGVITRVDGVTYYEEFSNANTIGRTGRGDTTFAAYLSRRMDYGTADSLKFAAALVSIKMESPGPFSGTMEDVAERMRLYY